MKTSTLSKSCVACGVIFFKPYSTSLREWNEQRKFCSHKCSLLSTSIHKQKNRGLMPPGFEPWNKGKKYGKEMKSRLDLSGLEKGRGFMKGKKFSQLTGENSARWKPKTIKNCLKCSKEMSLAPWASKRKFCSALCYSTWHRGKNSPVYKGDRAIKDLKTRVMFLPEYVAWRRSVMVRDKFTCQKCRKAGGELQAHHEKLYFFQIVEKFDIRTPEDAVKCETLWDISNGLTLCRKCHHTAHTFKDKRKT